MATRRKKRQKRRKLIPEAVKEEILLKSKRKCPLCFLTGLTEPQQGAIALVDRDSTNVESDNLVYLCRMHHAQFDRDELSSVEVRSARAALYNAVTVDGSGSTISGSEGRAFEDKVADYVRSEFAHSLGDFFTYSRNALYPGRSGVSHEVDLAAEFTVGGIRYLTIFEIKNRRSILGAQGVLEFAAKSNDVRADKAVLVCSAGFSASALRLAKDQGITLIQTDRNTGALYPVKIDTRQANLKRTIARGKAAVLAHLEQTAARRTRKPGAYAIIGDDSGGIELLTIAGQIFSGSHTLAAGSFPSDFADLQVENGIVVDVEEK